MGGPMYFNPTPDQIAASKASTCGTATPKDPSDCGRHCGFYTDKPCASYRPRAAIAAQTAPGSHTARSVHAALRTVLALSAAGNRWQAAQAGVLHQAASDAQALMAAHPVQPLELRESAEWLAARVQAGAATLADVAGPEIYGVAQGGA